jgi:hypothetical protein
MDETPKESLKRGRDPKNALDELNAAECTELFNLKSEEIKHLQATGAPKSEVACVAKTLGVLKKHFRKLKKLAKTSQGEARGTGKYPCKCVVPTSHDCRFVRDFDLDSSCDVNLALDFFKEYGFVVWRNILEPDECAATCSEMWDYHEQRDGVSRSDPSTWDLVEAHNTYGLPKDQVWWTTSHR